MVRKRESRTAASRKPVRHATPKKKHDGSPDPELVILTGMSGSGKASALKAFEDLGYYCVDNLPVDLILRFAELAVQSTEIRRTALVVDVREGAKLEKLPSIVKAVKRAIPTLVLFLEANDAALADSRLDVPQSAVRMARAIFVLHKPEQVQLHPRTLARLVFDSFREPAAAGVRSERQLARQTLYEAGDYTIDLRLEADADPAKVVMVGQIANRVQPEQPPRSVPVLLQAGREELGRTTTNEFGEFQLAYQPRTPLRLLIPIPLQGAQLEIAVPGAGRKAKRKAPR